MPGVVLLSGGMDSTVALFWAMHNLSVVDVVAIDYGQRHRLEISRAEDIYRFAKLQPKGSVLGEFRVVQLPRAMFAGAASILGSTVPVAEFESAEEAKKQNTTETDTAYIPLRNALFVAIAANHLLVKFPVGGVVVTGFRGRAGDPEGGFPDGTPEFSDAMTKALTIGAFGLGVRARNRRVSVWDPLNRPGRTRIDAFMMAEQFPGCWDALGWSLTCFNGSEPPCGKCLPCLRRAEAFSAYGKPDPIFARLAMTESKR